MAFQNICCDGYSHVSPSLPPALGIVDRSRSVGSRNGWSGAGRWFGGGICKGSFTFSKGERERKKRHRSQMGFPHFYLSFTCQGGNIKEENGSLYFQTVWTRPKVNGRTLVWRVDLLSGEEATQESHEKVRVIFIFWIFSIYSYSLFQFHALAPQIGYF